VPFIVAPGVDRCVVHADFVVDVRAGGAAADAAIADDLAALDAGAGNRGNADICAYQVVIPKP